jgi:alpha-glucosidase
MVCDYPAAYEGQPGFDFLKSVPSTWDETRVPVAIPGEWVAIARRKGPIWWLGAINSSTGRDAVIPLNFLPAGNYEVTIWRDSPDADHDPNQLIKEIRTAGVSGSLTIPLAPGGGVAMQLRRVEP